jgi:hypothetical protein
MHGNGALADQSLSSSDLQARNPSTDVAEKYLIVLNIFFFWFFLPRVSFDTIFRNH